MSEIYDGFDIEALAQHLVLQETDGKFTLDDLARLGFEATMPYYARAVDIIRTQHAGLRQ